MFLDICHSLRMGAWVTMEVIFIRINLCLIWRNYEELNYVFAVNEYREYE